MRAALASVFADVFQPPSEDPETSTNATESSGSDALDASATEPKQQQEHQSAAASPAEGQYGARLAIIKQKVLATHDSSVCLNYVLSPL